MLKKAESREQVTMEEVTQQDVRPFDDFHVVKLIPMKTQECMLKKYNEIAFNLGHDHPVLLTIKEFKVVAQDQGQVICILLPKMEKSLADEIEDRKLKNARMSKARLVEIFYKLIDALEYLEQKTIYHGNIKPQNILFNDSFDVFLGDIRMTKGQLFIDSDRSLPQEEEKSNLDYFVPHDDIVIGNIQYAAPEITTEIDPTTPTKNIDRYKCDVWSLGVVFLELATTQEVKLKYEFEKERIDSLLEIVKQEFGSKLGLMIQNMLHFDPKERWSFSQLRAYMESSIFAKIRPRFNQHLNPLKALDAMGEYEKLKNEVSRLENKLLQYRRGGGSIERLSDNENVGKKSNGSGSRETLRSDTKSMNIILEENQNNDDQDDDIYQDYDESPIARVRGEYWRGQFELKVRASSHGSNKRLTLNSLNLDSMTSTTKDDAINLTMEKQNDKVSLDYFVQNFPVTWDTEKKDLEIFLRKKDRKTKFKIFIDNLMNIGQQVKRLHFVSEAYTLDSRSCNSIAVALKNFTALECLKIEIPFLDEEEFQSNTFSQVFVDKPKLKQLILIFQTQVSINIVLGVLQELNKLTELYELTIVLQPTKVNMSFLEVLDLGLSSMKSLRFLHLEGLRLSEANDECGYLTTLLQNLDHLTHLKIDNPFPLIHESQMPNIVKYLKNLNKFDWLNGEIPIKLADSLKSLKYIYHLHFRIEDDLPLVCQIVKEIKQLTDLTVKYVGHAISEDNLRSLKKVVKEKTYLRNLCLQLGSNRSYSWETKNMKSWISNLTALNHLEFSLFGRLRDKGFNGFHKGLANAKNLHSIKILFPYYYKDQTQIYITDGEIDKLMSNLSQKQSLREVSILDLSAKHMSYKCGLKPFQNFITNSSKLIKLELALKLCHQISTQGYIDLAWTLDSLKQLSSLTIIFTEPTNFNSECLATYMSIIQRIEPLKYLTFGAVACHHLTNEMEQISKVPGRLKQLKALRLFFMDCKKFSFKSAHCFLECVQTNKSIKNLKMSVKGCPLISISDAQVLEDDLNKIPTMTHAEIAI